MVAIGQQSTDLSTAGGDDVPPGLLMPKTDAPVLPTHYRSAVQPPRCGQWATPVPRSHSPPERLLPAEIRIAALRKGYLGIKPRGQSGAAAQPQVTRTSEVSITAGYVSNWSTRGECPRPSPTSLKTHQTIRLVRKTCLVDPTYPKTRQAIGKAHPPHVNDATPFPPPPRYPHPGNPNAVGPGVQVPRGVVRVSPRR